MTPMMPAPIAVVCGVAKHVLIDLLTRMTRSMPTSCLEMSLKRRQWAERSGRDYVLFHTVRPFLQGQQKWP